MEAVVGLLLSLFGVSLGVETYCDGRQDGAQCYGALGGTVDIQLMDSSSEILKYRLIKNESVILDVRTNKVIFNALKHRSIFPSNGTFRINNLSRNDSGKYNLIIFDSDGKVTVQILQLIIQAPVSSVLLLSGCLSQGEMRVFCSCEGGDSPQYSWTLDGRTLTDAELLSGNNESNIITLKQHVSGDLVCSVRNNVSKVSKEQRISTCGFIFINCTLSSGTHISKCVLAAKNTLCNTPTTDPTETTVDHSFKQPACTDDQQNNSTSLLICGLKAAVVIILLIGISIYFAWKRKKNKTCQSSAVAQNMENPEDSVLMVEMRSSATYANT